MRDPELAGTVKLPTIEDAAKAGGFLAGRPEDIIEALKAVERRYLCIDRVICATPLGTLLDVQLGDRDRFCEGGDPGASRHQDRRHGSSPEDQPRATATRPSPPSVNFLVTQRTFVIGGNSHLSALES
jgi:hypothetical protein